jgi:soluble cytochrome b562
MNLESLLNRRPTLLESTKRLTSLVLKYNRQEIEAKSLLLKQRKETSKQRIKTFRNIQADANREDNTNDLLSGGLATGGGLSLLRGKKAANNIRPFRRPIKPGRLGGLSRISRISKGSVITNTLFAGLDFANRKSAGQTNLQAGLGAGGGAAGGIAGAAIGQALIPIPVLGALIGGFVGANIGSSLADRASGVTGGDFRRLQLERESVRQSQRTEFTEGLDRFDSALDKFKKYDDDLEAFILRATGNDDKDQGFVPIIPIRGGGATQAQIDSAYAKGIQVGIGGLALTVLGTAVAIKTGGLILGSGALVKLKSLFGFALVKKTKVKVLLKRLFQVTTKPKPNVIPKTPKITPRTIRLEKNDTLKLIRDTLKKVRAKDQAESVEELEKVSLILRSIRKGIESRAGGELSKGNKANFEAFKKVIKAYDKELKIIDRAIKFIKGKPDLNIQKAVEAAKKSLKIENIKSRIEKLENLKSKIERPTTSGKSKRPTTSGKSKGGGAQSGGGNQQKNSNSKSKSFNKNNSVNTSTIIKEGDNFIALNLPSSPTIIGDNFDPYISSLNIIKAYSEQTV